MAGSYHIRYKYRLLLWVSGVALVISAVFLAGTSVVFSTFGNDDNLHCGNLLASTVAEFQTLLDQLFHNQESLQVDALEEEEEQGDLEEDVFQSQLDPTNSGLTVIGEEGLSLEDAQSHRRLKRKVDRNENERERKAEQAKARAKKLNPSVHKDYVSTLPLDNDPEELQFNARYFEASSKFQDIASRQRLDPLGEFQTVSSGEQVSFEPQVQYLGVLVDAGRHYFPMDWLKRLIVYLHRLRFNLLHFRLTDDQTFNLQLDSFPELAFASVANTTQIVRDLKNQTKAEAIAQRQLESHGNNNTKLHIAQVKVARNEKTYTPNELRDLVAFAKEHGIAIMPEINVPGHAGAWAGIPNMTVNCPEFICAHGYGIPLNVEHPHLKPILKGILGEVLDIFDNPPLLHLGGDELDMSSPCFKELGRKPFDYVKFEKLLQEVLEDLNFPQERVLRWEETVLPTVYDLNHPKPPRTGTIEHFWRRLPGKVALKTNKKWKDKTFFVSRGLYMDVNHDEGAEDIYKHTVANFQIEKGPAYHPTGMVAGAFELGTDFWVQRNVASRLIAVAMGAARLNFTSMEEFRVTYNTTCQGTLGLDAAVCDLQGYTAVDKSRYQNDWKQTWADWTSAICDRMTDAKGELVMPKVELNFRATFEEANKHFWQTLKKPLPKRNPVRPVLRDADFPFLKGGATEDRRRVRPKAGVLIDVVNGMRPTSHTLDVLKKFIAPLGISLVQLRLADNYGFAMRLAQLSRVEYFPTSGYWNPSPKAEEYADLVLEAGEMGIEVYPEITLSTDAGGWVSSGFALNCPQAFCDESAPHGTLDIGKREFLAVAYSVVREFMEVFSTSSYIHLGSDERVGNLPCFQEDGKYQDPPFEAFERNLTKLLTEYLGMSTQHILRWENQEQVHYLGRTGDITHHRSTTPFILPTVREGEPFFVTLELLAPIPAGDSTHSVFYEIYKNTRQLMELGPLGILAEIRAMDELTWSNYYVGLRLISYRLGTRPDQDDYSPEEFQVQLAKECHRVQFDHCDKALDGTYDKMLQERVRYLVETEYFRKRTCDRNTAIQTTRIAKDVIQ